MIDTYAIKIPVEKRAKVLKIALSVQANKYSPKKEELEYLFSIYNEYLSPYNEQRIDCSACRAKVCGIFFQIIKLWKM